MTELLPCPFCGETTLELDCFGITDDEQPTDWRVTHIADVPCQAWGPECATRDEAIAAWNRRAPRPGYREGAEAMREAAAREQDCACELREFALTAAPNERWLYCLREPCGALEAAAIRALPIPEAPTK